MSAQYKVHITLTYSSFEVNNLLIGQSVCFGDNGNQIDFGVESSHKFDVNLLQAIHIM